MDRDPLVQAENETVSEVLVWEKPLYGFRNSYRLRDGS